MWHDIYCQIISPPPASSLEIQVYISNTYNKQYEARNRHWLFLRFTVNESFIMFTGQTSRPRATRCATNDKLFAQVILIGEDIRIINRTWWKICLFSGEQSRIRRSGSSGNGAVVWTYITAWFLFTIKARNYSRHKGCSKRKYLLAKHENIKNLCAHKYIEYLFTLYVNYMRNSENDNRQQFEFQKSLGLI